MAKPMTERNTDILRKLREICEYSDRTGDREPVRKIVAVLDQVTQVILETRRAIEQPELKKPAKKGRQKAIA